MAKELSHHNQENVFMRQARRAGVLLLEEDTPSNDSEETRDSETDIVIVRQRMIGKKALAGTWRRPTRYL